MSQQIVSDGAHRVMCAKLGREDVPSKELAMCRRPMQNSGQSLPDFMTNPNAVMEDNVAWRDTEPPSLSATRQKYHRGLWRPIQSEKLANA